MGKRKQQSFEYGAVILLFSTVLSKIIGACFKIPLSHIIGDLGFGYFSSAYDLFTPIYGLSMAGLPIAISRMVAENSAAKKYNDVKAVLRLSKKAFLVTGIFGLVFMLALTYPFVLLTDKTGGSLYSLLVIAPSLLFCCIMSAYRGYYEGLRNMFPTAVSDIIEAASKLVFGYLIAYIVVKSGGSVALSAAGAIMGITIGTILGALYLELRFRISGDGITEEELLSSPRETSQKELFKVLLPIAIPVVLSSLATNVAGLIDVSMVKAQLIHVMHNSADVVRNMYSSSIENYNATAKEALTDAAIPTFLYGIRGKAFTVYNLIPTIASVMGVSALPVLAATWTKDRNNKLEIKKNIESILRFTALISIPAGIGMAVLSKQIMGLLYSGYASIEIGAPMLLVFGIAAIFAGLSAPMTSMLQAIGKQIIPVRNIAIGAAVKIVVNFVLVGIPQINIHGAPIGTLCCFLFIFVANLVSLNKYSGVKPNAVTTFVKPLVAGLACGAVAYGVAYLLGDGKISTALAIVSAAVVYFAVLVLLHAFTEDDVLAFPLGNKALPLLKRLKIVK